MSKNRTLDSLIGQAAIFRVQGQNSEAIALLKEVIRQEPKKAEPYLHLSEILEDINYSSALECRVLYCNILTKPSSFDWEYAGDMAIKLKRFKQASEYYNKAISLDKTNWLVYEKRIKALEEVGLVSDAMKTRLLAVLSVDCIRYNLSYDSLNLMIKEVAQYYYHSNDDNQLILVLKASVKRSIQFNMDYHEQLLILIDVLKNREEFDAIIEVVLGFYIHYIKGLREDSTIPYSFSHDCKLINFPSTEIVKFEINSQISTNIILLLIVALLNCGFYDYSKFILPEIFKRKCNPEDIDKYLEVLSTYTSSADLNTGLNVAKEYLSKELFSDSADVYFYQGVIYEKQEKLSDAVDSYKRALYYDTDYVDARVNLSCILQLNGDTESALEVLKDTDLDEGHRLPDEKLLLRQLELLQLPEDQIQYTRTKRMLLAPYFYKLLKDEQRIFTSKRKETDMVLMLKRIALKMVNKSPMEKLIIRMGQISTKYNRELTLTDDELKVHCINLILELHNAKRFQEMLYICCLSSLHSKICTNDISNVLFYASLLTKNYRFCLEYVRDKIHTSIKSNKIELFQRYNLAMNFFLCHEHGEIYIKFYARLLDKFPNESMLLMIVANNSFVTGCYKSALARYVMVNDIRPNDPLVALMSSLSLLSLSCKRDMSNRHAIAKRAVMLLGKYRNCRKEKGPMQEIYYNIGRGFHQLGLYTFAVDWYEKVLEEPDICIYERTDGIRKEIIPAKKYDLKPLAAYNIICIIQEQNPKKAKDLRKKYCVLK